MDSSTKHKRGKKVEAGMRILPSPVNADHSDDILENPLDVQIPSSSNLQKPTETNKKEENTTLEAAASINKTASKK